MDWLNILNDADITAWANSHKVVIGAVIALLKWLAVLNPNVPTNKITDLFRLKWKPKPDPIFDIFGLPKRVSQLEKEVSENMAAIDDLNAEVTKIQTDVSEVQNVMVTMQQTIADLKAAIAANDPTVLNAAIEAAVGKLDQADQILQNLAQTPAT